MVIKRRKSKISPSIQEALIRQFVAGTTASATADLVGVNRHTATLYTSHDVLNASKFKHHRINHFERFVECKTNHINDIENFLDQAKRHMRRFSGIRKDEFPLFFKECEWRFNYHPTENLYKVLFKWAKQDLL